MQWGLYKRSQKDFCDYFLLTVQQFLNDVARINILHKRLPQDTQNLRPLKITTYVV